MKLDAWRLDADVKTRRVRPYLSSRARGGKFGPRCADPALHALKLHAAALLYMALHFAWLRGQGAGLSRGQKRPNRPQEAPISDERLSPNADPARPLARLQPNPDTSTNQKMSPPPLAPPNSTGSSTEKAERSLRTDRTPLVAGGVMEQR